MTLDELKKIYKAALFIRGFEDRLSVYAAQDQVPGLLHLSNGAEVAEAMLAHYLNDDSDRIFGSHRSHGLALAGGVDPRAMALEIMGLSGGLSDGIAGTQHLVSADTVFTVSNGIVGAQVPLALGAALSAKSARQRGLAVAVFGDGAANQGAVFESMNLAVVKALPILFFVENNGVAQSTASSDMTGSPGIAIRARAFGMPADQVDGYDFRQLSKALERLTAYCRDEYAPALLEVSVPRLAGHYFNPQATADNMPDKQGDDPLERLEAHLLAAGLDGDAFTQAKTDTIKSLDSAFDAVDNHPDLPSAHREALRG